MDCKVFRVEGAHDPEALPWPDGTAQGTQGDRAGRGGLLESTAVSVAPGAGALRSSPNSLRVPGLSSSDTQSCHLGL